MNDRSIFGMVPALSSAGIAKLSQSALLTPPSCAMIAHPAPTWRDTRFAGPPAHQARRRSFLGFPSAT